jgi:chromosome condensin MukBEF complex kleisin-like MukF subunit
LLTNKADNEIKKNSHLIAENEQIKRLLIKILIIQVFVKIIVNCNRALQENRASLETLQASAENSDQLQARIIELQTNNDELRDSYEELKRYLLKIFLEPFLKLT